MKLSRTKTLYLLSVVGSGCGFMTQMLVAGYWSTAFSHDVYHFSVNVACYFLCLGLGSLFSSKWKRPDLPLLFEITLLLCLWTGLSITFLKWGIARAGSLVYLPLIAAGVAGFLAGNIIPLTIRVGRDEPSMRLSRLFFFDYAAAILFTLLFTFVLLIPLGYSRTAIVLSLSSVAVTFLLMVASRTLHPTAWVLTLATLLVPYPLYEAVKGQAAPTLNSAGIAKVLVNRQSHYQKIVLTEEAPGFSLIPGMKQHVLYLDGFVQFSSMDEQSYHICIANIPVAAVEYTGEKARKALILGGGDGLAARNLARVNTVESITLVELDPQMIELAYHEPMVRLYNLDSLRNPKVKVITEDAFRWVHENEEKFDVIVIDFPAPKNVTLSRLFSAEFYSAAFRHLNPGGFVSIQAGPSFSFEDKTLMTVSKVTSSVKKTVEAVGYQAHVYAAAREEDAFVLATGNRDFDMTRFAETIGILGTEAMGMICTHNPDWKLSDVKVNTLNTLVLSGYMLEWFKAAGGPFFNFQGHHAVFLPD